LKTRLIVAHVHAIALLNAFLWVAVAAEEVPYGHRDFYPSLQRPIGFRADGAGCFPGATPVTEWWEGDYSAVPLPKPEPPLTHVQVRKGESKNIVWRVPVPGWSDTQPVVVGDRIVGMADPDWVFCLDAHTGKTLWQDRLMPMFLGPPPTNDAPSRCPYPPDVAWRRQQVADIARVTSYLWEYRSNEKEDPMPYNTAAMARVDELRQKVERLDDDPAILDGLNKLMDCWAARCAGDSTIKHGVALLSAVDKRERIRLFQCWSSWVGYTQSSPVTDGERVYVAFGPGQVAAYDLTGKRLWAWRDVEFTLGALYVEHTPSPIIADGVLIVRDHQGDLMGVDPKTGRVLHRTDVGPAYNHGAFATPGAMTLTSPSGKKLVVVITQHDKVIAARDGRIVATLPQFKNNTEVGHGQPRMVWKDLVVLHSSQGVPPGNGPCAVAKLALADDGTVTATLLHKFNGSGGWLNEPYALTGDGYILGGSGGWKGGPGTWGLWNLTDGTLVKGSFGFGPRGGMVKAGPYVFSAYWVEEPRAWHVLNTWKRVTFMGARLPGADVSEELPGRRELGFDDPTPDSDMETLIPGFKDVQRALPRYFGLRNSGFVPSGNRIFAQTWAFMYCIGDPAKPYDWNPASRPAELTRLIEEDVKARAAAGPLAGLTSQVKTTRDRAIAAFDAMSAADKASAIPTLLAAVETLAWPGLDTGVGLLRSLGRSADSAASPRLLAALEQTTEKGLTRELNLLVSALVAVNPGSAAAIVAQADKLISSKESARLVTACACIGGLGPAGRSRAGELVRLVSHQDAAVALAAAAALADLGDDWGTATSDGIAALSTRLVPADVKTTEAALEALAALGPKAAPAIAGIEKLLAEPALVPAAAPALGAMGAAAARSVPALLNACDSGRRSVLQACADAVLGIDPKQGFRVVGILGDMLKNGDEKAPAAVGVLAGFSARKDVALRRDAVSTMIERWGEANAELRNRIAGALAQYGKDASAAVPKLRVAANIPETAGPAKAALARIAPGQDAKIEIDADLNVGLTE
jgi:outer membrane protein assembly factor BamB